MNYALYFMYNNFISDGWKLEKFHSRKSLFSIFLPSEHFPMLVDMKKQRARNSPRACNQTYRKAKMYLQLKRCIGIIGAII